MDVSNNSELILRTLEMYLFEIFSGPEDNAVTLGTAGYPAIFGIHKMSFLLAVNCETSKAPDLDSPTPAKVMGHLFKYQIHHLLQVGTGVFGKISLEHA